MLFIGKVSLRTYLADILTMNAPVMAGLKPCSIYTVKADCMTALRELFRDTEIKLYTLFADAERVTLLLYREAALSDCLNQRAHAEFLAGYGYRQRSLSAALRQLRTRFSAFRCKLAAFPHELGLFLGYPLCDVRGFIQNDGRNELYTGHWKVYGNLEQTLAVFHAFDAAIQDVSRKIENGVPLKYIVLGCSEQLLNVG